MNHNYAAQNMGIIAWTGGATPVATPIDIRKHIGFAFTFKVTADLAADTTFLVQAAPASDSDPCAPGAFANILETLICESSWGAVPAAQSTIKLPAGTKAGSICQATLPCRPNAFIKLVAGAGTPASVEAVVTLHGPR